MAKFDWIVYRLRPATSPGLGRVMNDEYRKKLNIPAENKLVETASEREQRRGQDADIYYFDEVNPAGEIVGKHKIKDSMSIYPPQTRTLTVEPL